MMKKFVLIGFLVPAMVGTMWSSYYKDRVYPGIQIAGIAVGGNTKEQTISTISRDFKTTREINLVWGDREWKISSLAIGLQYKVSESLDKAMEIGRGDNAAINLRQIYLAQKVGTRIDPVFDLDENNLNAEISKIAMDINIPAKEPEIVFDKKSGVINVTPGENGQEVDMRLLSQRILQTIKNIDYQRIEVPVVQLQPKLGEDQVRLTQARAQKLRGKRLNILGNDYGQNWTLEEEQILAWIDPQGSGWKERAIEIWVADLAQTVDRPAENANFRFVEGGKVEEFKPGKDGLRIKQLDMKREIIKSLTALEQGQVSGTVSLTMETTQPEIKTGDANNLGIKELIGRGESWFSGSIDNRIFNIKKATEEINGLLIAPGETFSFNDNVGEISQATGYKPAYIIKDGKTILGDGGGVCQVSSTLFRAVLNAGLPIKERYAHAYRVHYYEEKSEPGFDATIFQPSPDFKFVNDTPAYILLQTNFDPISKHVVFDFYGTSDGRKASISKARIWEVVPPPPTLYQDDPTKPAGYLVQVEHSAWGAKVAFDWKVTRGDEVLQDRTFYSNYASWQAVYIRGTKQQ